MRISSTTIKGASLVLFLAALGLTAQSEFKQNELKSDILPIDPAATSIATPDAARTLDLAPEQAQARRLSYATLGTSISSVDDLAGNWVQSYETLASSCPAGGGQSVITPIAGTDSISISNFYAVGLTAKAAVDVQAGKVYIPSQQIYTDATYGDCDLAFCTSAGKPDRTRALEGTINADGSITFDDWWGVFINEGTYADLFIAAQYDLSFERANAVMSYTYNSSGNTYSVNVRVDQTSANVASIKNFMNYGRTVDVVLNRDKTGTIAQQLGIQRIYNSTLANFYTVGNLTLNSSGSLTSYTANITTDAATDDKVLSWTNWSLVSTEVSVYMGQLVNTTVTMTEPLSYPTLSVSDFTGEGTEESPYLITKLDELILLADRVNTDTTTNAYSTTGGNYLRAFLGKHFRLDSDIDMTGYRFDPIGRDWSHIFAGTFDGNGHTLTGLTIESNTKYYNGLFGRVDTLGVVKNLTMASPSLNTVYYTGAVAGWSMGTISNCHVTNPDITNTGTCTGAVAGVANYIDNCTVSGGTINALGGYGGGVAGEVDKQISDCHVYGTTILCYATSTRLPFGGVAGTLYKANGSNLSYAGFIDSYSKAQQNCVGGVVGSLYVGTLSNSFSVGRIRSYGSDSRNGGVVGTLCGNIENCYSAGRVDGYSSKQTGGITGYITTTTVNGELYNSSISNSYTSAEMTAETYLYDGTTGVRELFGEYADGATPTVTNVYYDKQMTSFGTTLGAALTSELTSANGPSGFSSDVWTFKAGFYPTLKISGADAAAALSSASLQFDEVSSTKKVLFDTKLSLPDNIIAVLYKNGSVGTEGHYSSIADGTLKIGLEAGADTLFFSDGTVSHYHILSIAPVRFDGDGTLESPYLIQTKADLVLLSQITTVNGQLYPDTYFRITNDIDLEFDPDFVGIAADPDDSHGQFAGTIDGDGHAIHRMRVGHLAWTTRPEDSETGLGTPYTSDSKGYTGFVGRLAATGVVKNLTIAADCDLSETWATSGAVVGYLYGTVDNCRNYADVTAYSCWVGGIVGQTVGYDAVIRNCYNAGNITTGYFAAGGIVGSGSAIIENCVNTGDIRAMRISTFAKDTQLAQAGGIVGTSAGSKITNVVNAGNIYASSSKAGGIAGSLGKTTTTSYPGLNEVRNAVNYGMVSTADLTSIGAIGGLGGTVGEWANNLWDAQIMTLKAIANGDYTGATGVETSVLTGGTLPEGFDADLWDFTAGLYPTLKQFAAEPKMQAARSMIVNIPSGITVADLRTNATLADVEGLTWSLAQGTVYSIDGRTLKAPVTVAHVVTDTLTLALDSLSKQIVVMAAPAVPLTGEGTEASPYLIQKAADWVSLAEYMNSVADDLTGKYVKLTADIVFDDATPFVPLANDGVTAFAGTLLGDGHTVSGISYTTTATYQGAIFTLAEAGTISDLTLEGTISSAYSYTGGFVGKLYGTLRNCVNRIDVSSTKTYTGGFGGYVYTGASFTGCVNEGTISASGAYLAGFSAISQAGVDYTDCVNKGDINYTGTTTAAYVAGLVANAYPGSTYVGCSNEADIAVAQTISAVAGLIAMANGAKDSDPYVITNCHNTGSITAGGLMGGLVATTNTTAGYAQILMTDCSNEGDITANAAKTTSNFVAGGIFGKYSAGSTIRNCSNSGSITNINSVYTGGIAGTYAGTPTAAYPVLFTGCSNEGEINASGNQGGGILGYAAAYTTVDSCSNVAEIQGGSMLGGIVAALAGAQSAVKNSWNTGNVTGTLNRIGGLIGYGAGTNAQVENSWNSGDVRTTGDVKGTTGTTSNYGIGGLAGATAATFTNCHNTGSVSGASQVGGLVGQPSKGKTSFTNCYNAGRVVADADTCGAIVGVDVTNSKIWTDGNSAENTYYVAELVTSSLQPIGTGVSIAQLAKLDLGDDWTSADDYSLPLTKGYASLDAALVNSATVVPADGETWDNIQTAFHVGLPEGVEWSATALVTLEGNTGTPNGVGTVTLTASKGNFAKALTLTIVSATGIDVVSTDAAPVDEAWYTTGGARVNRPASADGQVYIVVAKYADGTIKSYKVVNK